MRNTVTNIKMAKQIMSQYPKVPLFSKDKKRGVRISAGEIDKVIGSRIRMLRRLADMTQKELGESLGVTFQQIQKYEKGSNRISASMLLEIANYFQQDVSLFFSDLQEN